MDRSHFCGLVCGVLLREARIISHWKFTLNRQQKLEKGLK